jgi:hypothetical protein
MISSAVHTVSPERKSMACNVTFDPAMPDEMLHNR